MPIHLDSRRQANSQRRQDCLPNESVGRTARKIYLEKTLGLSHDPFAAPVAEQELNLTGQPTHFFDYYVDPLATDAPPLLEALRESRNAFIFGPPGSGKTTLRYTLESECRVLSDRTLVVACELSDDLSHALSPDEHWRRLADELAVDLFIQIVERFNALDTSPTEAQRAAWRGQMARIWRAKLSPIVEEILDPQETDIGLESLWPDLGRPAIRYFASSPQLRELLLACQPINESTLHNHEAGADLFSTGLQAAQSWGFRRVFVLVDGVDARQRTPEGMYALIEPLVAALEGWQAQDVFFKFFLPTELEETIQKRLGQPVKHLPRSPFRAIIRWNESALKQLLGQRFRAAEGWYSGFDDLADAGLAGQLDGLIARTADGSPRRLLQVASRLIDAHAECDPSQLLIDAGDWNTMCRDWAYERPAPTPLGLSMLALPATPHGQPFREFYQSSLFVGRAGVLAMIEAWAITPENKRLLNIKAPPGYGKSWLLRETERRLSNNPEFYLIWAEAIELDSTTAIAKWLEKEVRQAKQHSRNVRDYDPTVELGQMIRALLEDVREHCNPDCQPILIVDTMDTIPDTQQIRLLERRLLEEFWSNPYARILVALRDDYALRSPTLRRGERPLALDQLSTDEGHQQLEKRATSLATPPPADLLNTILPYSWQTPGFNSYLTRRAAQNRQDDRTPLLQAEDLRHCRREVIGPKLSDILDKHLECLSRQLTDTWTQTMFAQECQLSSSQAGKVIQEFFALGIVMHTDIPQRLKIVDGLRELMRAESALRGQGGGVV
jgi:Ni2+-binding GTPase involved in maturation of urease and hydrogenase